MFFFQLCFRESSFFFVPISVSIRISEICIERKDAPSSGRDTEHLNCLRLQPARSNMIFHVFGVSGYFFFPATKRGRRSKAELSEQWGQGNRCPQFHLSFLLPRCWPPRCISAVSGTVFATLPQRWCGWELIYLDVSSSWRGISQNPGGQILNFVIWTHQTTSTSQLRNLNIRLVVLKNTCLLLNAVTQEDGAGQTGQETQNSSSGTCDIFSEAIVCFI